MSPASRAESRRSPAWRPTFTAPRKASKRRALPSYRFFGGKGGVGKTTSAAARAVSDARRLRGRRVLVLSTDPAHSLGDALDMALGGEAARVSLGGELFAMELDARAALERWLGEKRGAIRLAAERGTYFDREDIDDMLAQAMPGIDELIGLVEIARAGRESEAELIVVDTAPTGHTLRLLAMPETLERMAQVFDDMLAKHRYLKEAISGRYREDAADRVIGSIAEEAKALREVLEDPERCRFTWVLVPEPLAVEETLDGVRALEEMGIDVDEIVVNRLTPVPEEPCELCETRVQIERDALAPLAPLAEDRRLYVLETLDEEPRGLSRLASLGPALEEERSLEDLLAESLPRPKRARAKDARASEAGSAEGRPEQRARASEAGSAAGTPVKRARASEAGSAGEARKAKRAGASEEGSAEGRRARLSSARAERVIPRDVRAPRARARAELEVSPKILELLAPRTAKLIIVGGKGGVGKTTVASTIALAVAARDPKRDVLLLSIDPAHSLGDALDVELGDDPRTITGAPKRLVARELDAPAEFALQRDRYREGVEELFSRLRGSSRFDVAFDRTVLQGLFDLAPPGIDELFAVLSVIEALVAPRGRDRARYDTAIIDTAPTGHALRFLELPAEVREWVRVFMRIVLKYRAVIGLGELAEDLLDLARRLRELEGLLHDPTKTQFVVVSRPTELARLETERLIDALREQEIAIGGVVFGAVTPAGCARCGRIRRAENKQISALARKKSYNVLPMFALPKLPVPPVGVDALSALGAMFEKVR